MKKLKQIIMVLIVAFLMLPNSGSIQPTMALENKDTTIRLGGSDRIETAIKVSKQAYKEEAKTVILVGSQGEVDALTGTILAAINKAPVLFTHKNTLSDKTKEEIIRLKAKNIIILGGSNAVSENVESSLKSLELNVERIGGINRYETAAKIAIKAKESHNTNHAFIVLGYAGENSSLADALAVGPISAIKKDPVLLVKTNNMPPETVKSLKDLGITTVTIIGGKEAVNGVVETKLKAENITIKERIAGVNREETAVEIAKKFFKESKSVLFANGHRSADALIGGYFGALLKAPILFTSSKTNFLPEATNNYLEENKNIDKGYLLGGTSVISNNVENLIEALIKEKDDEETPPFTPDPSVAVSAITVTGDGPVVNGKTLQMGVDITPTTATNKKVTWSVINGTGSATINSSGLLTATGVGTVTVKAAAQDGSGKDDTKEITIHADLTDYNAALAAVTKTDYTTDSWNAYQLIVDDNVVTVTNTQEEVTTATNNIIAAQANLVIPVTGISISGNGSVAKDDTLQLTAIITPSNATNPDVTWSIETGGTGSATINTDGLLTGTGVGTVTVKVVSQYKETITATKEITVEASALDAAKANAKTELDTYVDADDYAINNATELATAISDGKSAIDSASDIAGVTTALANAKVEIDDIKTDAEIAAEELATAKDNAKTDLGTYVDADDYTTNATALNTAIAEGKTAIDNAIDIAGVNTALTNAKAAIDAIKTDAQIAAEELATAKDNAKTELDTYVDVADYTTNAAALSTAIADGKSAIDGASDIAGVATALADAKAAIDTIKSDAQIAAEELATAKENAKAELDTYVNADNYTRKAAVLSTAIANGKTAIDNATDIAGANTALANAKAVIDAIKSDKDLDDDDIATAKTNIEGESYTATQAEVSDAGVALSKAQALVSALELKETTATVVAGTLAEAVAGDSSTPAGINGSYTFTVTIAKGAGTEVTTAEQTMTITATPYDSTEQDNADIANAKTNIESATYIVTQAEASDSAKALTKAQALVNALELKGTKANVLAGTFTGAITGTEDSVNGTDGSYTFTVKIIKGLGAEVTTTVQTMTITATSYDPTADNADIATAKAKIESEAYTATQAEVSDASAAKTKVETIISGLDTAETIVEVVPGSFSGAIAGVEGVFDPTDGSYTFTVKINKGGGTEAITKELSLTITAETTTVTKASKVEVNGDKTLDSSKPYLVNGEPKASGTLGSADCTAHFDSSSGVLTLQGYNGAEIRTLYESNPDLIIKLIGNNTVTTTNLSMGIYNGHYGNIYITSDSDATLNVNSTSDNNYVYAIATNDVGGKSIIIGGKAKVTVTAATTAADKRASVAHAGKDFIIQDNASLTGTSTATVNGSYAIFAKNKIVINTTGNVDIDCSASSGSYAFNGMSGVDIKNVTLMTLKIPAGGYYGTNKADLSRVAVHKNGTDNIATYRGGVPYNLTLSNGQITEVKDLVIGTEIQYKYQGLENDEITIKAKEISNFAFVKWTNQDGTDLDSALFVSPTDANSLEAKIKMPAKDLNIKAQYKSTIFTTQPVFHRGDKKITWNISQAANYGKLQKKNGEVWEDWKDINAANAGIGEGTRSINNNSGDTTNYAPDGTYRLKLTISSAPVGFRDHYSEEFEILWNAQLVGTVTISGTPKYGETLTANVTVTQPDAGDLKYQWFADSTEISGATEKTLVLGADQVGKQIKVKVSSHNYNMPIESAATVAVAKADGPAAIDSYTGTSEVETNIKLAGLGASTPNLEVAVAIDGSTYDEYRNLVVDGDGKAWIFGLTGVNASTKVKVRIKESPTHFAGADREITVTVSLTPLSLTAPTIPTGLQEGKTNVGAGANIITELTATGGVTPYTYSLEGTDSGRFTIDSSSGLIGVGTTALTAGTYNFTVKVTDGASATATKDVTITVAAADPITASISNVVATNGTVTITLDKKPSVEPIADDFTATSKIDSGVANTLELAGFNYDDNVTVTYNFTPVVKTDVVQNVVVAVTYNLFEKVAPAFEVEANVGVTETPVITGPVRGGDTSVSGTAVDGATVVLSVNASAKPGVIATGGNWTVSELTLVENDVIKVTAILEPNTISSEATTTVLAAPDFALGSGTEVNPYQVSSAEELNKVRNHLDKHFKQTADINLSTYTTDGGWQPIGDSTIPFTGTYDGNNFKISNLTINRPDAKEQGLFGSTASAKVENCRISGSVTGKNSVGGLVGYNYSGTISKSYSSVAVQGVNSVGGLVGSNRGPADGTDNGIIENSYASGKVIGEKFTGGLVGVCQDGNITNSYATGFVTGGASDKGGLTGAKYTSSVITSSYYDIDTTGQSGGIGVGKTTAEMKQADTFVGWDFETIWTIVEDFSYPTLK